MFGPEQIENWGVIHWDKKKRKIKKRGFGEKGAKFMIEHVGFVCVYGP